MSAVHPLPLGSARGTKSAAVAKTPKFLAYAIVAVGALFMLAPFYFMFVFATQSRTDIFNVPPPLWFSDELLNKGLDIMEEELDKIAG